MGKIKDFLFSVKVGAPVEYLGRADEVVIKYQKYYISLLIDPVTDDIKSMGWTDNPALINVPLKGIWRAEPPKPKKPIALEGKE